MIYNKLNEILTSLMNGNLSCLNSDNIIIVSNEAARLLSLDEFNESDKNNANLIILISQIVYNNTDRNHAIHRVPQYLLSSGQSLRFPVEAAPD